MAFSTGLGMLIWMSVTIFRLNRASYALRLPTLTIAPGGCPRTDLTRAVLETPDGMQAFGVHLDWNLQTPTVIAKALGVAPAVVNAFLQLDTTKTPPIDLAMMLWHGQQARLTSSFLQLTIEPSRSPSEISTIPQSIIDSIVAICLKINTDYGTPIYLRFAHEMNGDWTFYGYAPIEYRLGFQRFATSIRKATNLTGNKHVTKLWFGLQMSAFSIHGLPAAQ